MDPADPHRSPAGKLRKGLTELTGILNNLNTGEGMQFNLVDAEAVIAQMRVVVSRMRGAT